VGCEEIQELCKEVGVLAARIIVRQRKELFRHLILLMSLRKPPGALPTFLDVPSGASLF
jgi:hypothetical protein